MAGTVQLIPRNKTLFVAGNDTILDAALQAGLSLNYGCSNGNCGKCKARIISGDTECIRHHDYVVSAAERSMGYALLCCHAPRGDVIVETDDKGSAGEIPLQELSAKVKRITPLTGRVSELHLQTPRTHRLRFLAGQSVTLGLASGAQQQYPIASCPCDDRNIQFHLSIDGHDEFALQLCQLHSHDVVHIEGPSGSFTLNEDSINKTIFIAVDTGFAPIKSLIEHAMQLEHSAEIRLYWLVPAGDEPYLPNLVRAWCDAFDHFYYETFTYIEQSTSRNDSARFCTPLEHALRGLKDPGSYDVYIAGPGHTPRPIREIAGRVGMTESNTRISFVDELGLQEVRDKENDGRSYCAE